MTHRVKSTMTNDGALIAKTDKSVAQFRRSGDIQFASHHEHRRTTVLDLCDFKAHVGIHSVLLAVQPHLM